MIIRHLLRSARAMYMAKVAPVMKLMWKVFCLTLGLAVLLILLLKGV